MIERLPSPGKVSSFGRDRIGERKKGPVLSGRWGGRPGLEGGSRHEEGDARSEHNGQKMDQLNRDGPSCLAVVLEHTPTRQRNPEVSLCAPEYSPYPGHTLPDALSRFAGRLPFYDPSGLVRYPVSGPQLPEARLLVTSFQPAEHVFRRLVIPGVRLENWEPQTN